MPLGLTGFKSQIMLDLISPIDSPFSRLEASPFSFFLSWETIPTRKNTNKAFLLERLLSILPSTDSYDRRLGGLTPG